MILKNIYFFILVLGTTICSAQVAIHKDDSKSFEDRAKYLVSLMTLQEKVSQMSYNSVAIDRLEIPEMNWWNECLHGVARAGIATVFPAQKLSSLSGAHEAKNEKQLPNRVGAGDTGIYSGRHPGGMASKRTARRPGTRRRGAATAHVRVHRPGMARGLGPGWLEGAG